MKLPSTKNIFFILFVLLFGIEISFGQTRSLGEMAVAFSASKMNYGELVIGIGYISGIGFGIASAYKFKQYKDNPTQIPIGTPFALLFVSVLMVTMPGLINVTTRSLFGDIPQQTACQGLPGGC